MLYVMVQGSFAGARKCCDKSATLPVQARWRSHLHDGSRCCWPAGPSHAGVQKLNPETPISIQKRHPYTGNLNSEMLGDSQNALLQWGGVLAVCIHEQDMHDCAVANALTLHVISHKTERRSSAAFVRLQAI